jgi:hypothetical protein
MNSILPVFFHVFDYFSEPWAPPDQKYEWSMHIFNLQIRTNAISIYALLSNKYIE